MIVHLRAAAVVVYLLRRRTCERRYEPARRRRRARSYRRRYGSTPEPCHRRRYKRRLELSASPAVSVGRYERERGLGRGRRHASG